MKRFKKGDLVSPIWDNDHSSHGIVISKRYYKDKWKRDCVLVTWIEPVMGIYFRKDSTFVKNLKLIARGQ